MKTVIIQKISINELKQQKINNLTRAFFDEVKTELEKVGAENIESGDKQRIWDKTIISFQKYKKEIDNFTL